MRSEKGRFTDFLGAENSDEKTGLLELTYNWDPEEYTGGRNFGHLIPMAWCIFMKHTSI